jgi:protein-tyrosine-phosphatase
MAEAIMRRRLYELGKDSIDVRSAGIRALGGMGPSDETIAVMKEDGVDVSDFKTKNVTADMIKKADLIITMEPLHKDEILSIVPEAKGKTYLLKEYGSSATFNPKGFSVHDPMGKPVEEYRITRDEIKGEIERIVKEF